MLSSKEIEKKLSKAASLCQEGKLDEAKNIYEDLILICPSNSDVLTNLGTIKLNFGRLDEAEALLNSSISILRDPLAINNLATVYIRQKNTKRH